MDATGNFCTNSSGGGGGGGAVTIADGADVAQGAKADSAYAGSGDTTVVGALKGIYSAIASNLLPTGTAGTPATTVLTVQGISGMTAMNTTDNLAQVNGVTVLAGAGATGTGSQRVTAAQDTTTIAGSAPGTAGTASANVLSVQGIASATPVIATGSGAAGTAATGVLTVQGITSMTPILANPGTAANWGVVATAAAPPANAVYSGARSSGATSGLVAGLISCDSHVFKHITSATDTLAVQGVTSQSVYICGWRSRAAGTATWYLENTASTNANCSSSNTQITGVASEVANSGETMLSPFWTGLKNTSGNGLCINSTGTGGVDVDIWYAQF